jgi:hypothetical protein
LAQGKADGWRRRRFNLGFDGLGEGHYIEERGCEGTGLQVCGPVF